MSNAKSTIYGSDDAGVASAENTRTTMKPLTLTLLTLAAIALLVLVTCVRDNS